MTLFSHDNGIRFITNRISDDSGHAITLSSMHIKKIPEKPFLYQKEKKNPIFLVLLLKKAFLCEKT